MCYVLVANWNTLCENTAQCLLYNSVHIIYWARKFVSFIRWITENGSFLATWKNKWTFLNKSPNIYFFWYAHLFYILQFKILSPQNAKKKKKQKKTQNLCTSFWSWHCRKKQNIEAKRPSFKLKLLLTVWSWQVLLYLLSSQSFSLRNDGFGPHELRFTFQL